MRRIVGLLIGWGIAVVPAPATGQGTPALKLSVTRLDCGVSRAPMDLSGWSDTHALDGQKRPRVASCYLIRHGDELMIWDTGFSPAAIADPKSPMRVDRTLVDQLRQLGVDPAKVGRVGISHIHADHTGQARDFPAALLLLGAADWAQFTTPAPGFDTSPFTAWLTGGGKAEPVRGDKDVFGDGSVVMLNTPGHTAGHHALLVMLKGHPLLLTGDAAHFEENLAAARVPAGNVSRADTLASMARVKEIAANLHATVVIQHDPNDVAKLPPFPQAAE